MKAGPRLRDRGAGRPAPGADAGRRADGRDRGRARPRSRSAAPSGDVLTLHDATRRDRADARSRATARFARRSRRGGSSGPRSSPAPRARGCWTAFRAAFPAGLPWGLTDEIVPPSRCAAPFPTPCGCHERDRILSNAPVSWGVYEAATAPVSADTYLDEVAAAGYRGTELGPAGFMPEDPERLTAMLAARGLALVGAVHVHDFHGPAEALDAGLDRIAPLLVAGGARVLTVMDAGERYGEAPADLAAALDRAGRRLTDRHGLTLAFHPHVLTAVETEAQIDRLLAACRRRALSRHRPPRLLGRRPDYLPGTAPRPDRGRPPQERPRRSGRRP